MLLEAPFFNCFHRCLNVMCVASTMCASTRNGNMPTPPQPKPQKKRKMGVCATAERVRVQLLTS